MGPALTPWSATGVPKVAARRCDGLSESNAVVLAFIMEAMPVLYVYPDRDAIRLNQRSGSRIADLACEETDHRRQLFLPGSGFQGSAPVDSPHAQTNAH